MNSSSHSTLRDITRRLLGRFQAHAAGWVAACAGLGGWLAFRQARANSQRRPHLAS